MKHGGHGDRGERGLCSWDPLFFVGVSTVSMSDFKSSHVKIVDQILDHLHLKASRLFVFV